MDVHNLVTDSQTDTAEYKFDTAPQYYSSDDTTEESGHLPLSQSISQTCTGVLPGSP